MLMKVFNKGQIVIPAEIRRAFGIRVGDRLEVEVDREHRAIALHKPEQRGSQSLAGALSAYAREKPFPTRREMEAALAKGLRHG
jgi:AbrB family looped-hinge helix DNA binding protein